MRNKENEADNSSNELKKMRNTIKHKNSNQLKK